MAGERDVPVRTTGRGSLMTIHPGARSSSGCCSSSCLDAGHWLAARGMIALSLPITDEECAAFVAAFDAILARHADLLC